MLERLFRQSPIPLLSMLALVTGTPAIAAPPQPASMASTCKVTIPNDQAAEALCALPPEAGGRNLRFKVRFIGSHDDSIVSLRTVELNGAPVACRDGSKTASRFEDGEVTLDCGFPAPATPLGGELRIQISMHHLQLDGTELVFE